MRDVRTDRNIWKDIVLWSVLSTIAAFLLSLIPIVGVVLGVLVELAYLVYFIYYYWKLAEDLNEVCNYVENDKKNNSWNYLLVWFVGIITLGTYIIYWRYKHGGRLHKALKAYGVDSEETGVVYLLWNTVGALFFGAGAFISNYLLIKNLNIACEKYILRNSNSDIPCPIEVHKKPLAGDEDITRNVSVIVGVGGEYAGQELTISSGDEIIMGRDAQRANLVFSSEKISKVHCRITFSRSENCYYVTDQSRNGVFIDGARKLESGKRERINRGTKIRIGDNEVFLLR